MDQTRLITAYTHIKGHLVAQLKLIMWVVPSKGFAPKPISDVFLTYVQRFDIVPQVNPISPQEQDLFRSLPVQCLSSDEQPVLAELLWGTLSH